ncbi:sensor histidine kinase [Rhodospirillaceae bacterium SYSU D60014]|uniref:sensor histidine kinase n=1 Tax=Virgifigura deserti TaxID=2268457 RepID=UPI0013C4AA92
MIQSDRYEEAAKEARRRPRSLVSKLVLLVIVFVAVPVALYHTFLQAELERRALLIGNVQEQGRLVALGLEPFLMQEEPSPLLTLSNELDRFASSNTRIRVLFRPADQSGVANFFYVAAVPTVPTAILEYEREELMRQGILDSVAVTCTGDLPLANRYRDPDGREEVLTSITPVLSDRGCWAIIVSHPIESFLGTSLGQPYWMRFEVRMAAGIYLIMAALTLIVFLSIRRSVLRFRRLARDLRTGAVAGKSFASHNEVAELAGAAEEFDRLIKSLRSSAENIRQAAEDNAHAYKTPIAIMRQSLEPLKRIVSSNDSRSRRAVEVLETSIERLDQLVSTSRRMDETMAELVDPPRQKVNLSRLLQRMAIAYGNLMTGRGLRLVTTVDDDVTVRASEDLLETVVENILDNSVSLSPPGSQITVTLRRGGRVADLRIQDQGPGVPPEDLERIFERRFTSRPVPKAPDGGLSGKLSLHAGIGLWIVRRNVEAVGGLVRAENAPGGGLILRLSLPLAT